MPVQKGKRRKRPRHRVRQQDEAGLTVAPSRTATPVAPSRDRGRGFQGPLWFNLVLGVFMLVAGIVFTVLPQHGISLREKLLILIGYLVLAGFYLFRAYRQYRRRGT